MTYDNTNRGALFKNDKKETDKHPDYKGNINVGGVEYWLSAWLDTAKSGVKYMSLSVQPKESQGGGGDASGDPRGGDLDDEIPF